MSAQLVLRHIKTFLGYLMANSGFFSFAYFIFSFIIFLGVDLFRGWGQEIIWFLVTDNVL